MSLPILLPQEYFIGSLDLADVADCVLVADESGGNYMDPGYQIPGRDGLLYDPLAPWSPLVISLTTWVRNTSDVCLIDHEDGKVGHMWENLSTIKRALAPGLVLLTREVPHAGAQQTYVKSVTKPIQLFPVKRAFQWILTAPSGSWQGAQQSETGTSPTLNTIGDRIIFDPILIFSAAGSFTMTGPDGIVYTIVAASGPTYPVTINVGAGTVIDNASADARGAVTFNHQHWFRLYPNVAQATTSSVSVTVTWRDRWA